MSQKRRPCGEPGEIGVHGVQRWRMSPIERPPLPAVDAYFTRLAARPPFLTHCDNGLP